MMDVVKMQRMGDEPRWNPDIWNLMKSYSEHYMKIRATLEVMDGERYGIVQHIKSFLDWEYFIDNFTTGTGKVFYSKFNSVRIVGDTVELLYEPLHYRWDENNCKFGICKMEDVMNIASIIEERKAYYKLISK